MDKYTLEPEVTLVETVKINKYTYTLIDLIPHKSVQYNIYCYYDDVFVKSITGLIEGKEYLEWINDDYLDNLIKTKINGDI